jgi:hypothetical protein
MSSLLLTLLFASAADKEESFLRYLRPADGKFVPESVVTIVKEKSGSVYTSETMRGKETMALRVERGVKGELVRAEITHTIGKEQKTARLEPAGGKVMLSRGETREVIDVKDPVIFTTAPDWSDIIEMAARFDPKKEGKQEFAGVWFHPTMPAQTPRFSFERLGTDTIAFGKEDCTLTRCRARIRGGSAYLVWVFANGRVCKLMTEGGKGSLVVLAGYEEATKDLK